MEVKSRMLCVPVLLASVFMGSFASVITATSTTTWRPSTTTWRPTTTTPTATTQRYSTTATIPWTTGHPAVNLNGMMFTLSYNQGGISFYPPYYSPHSSAWPSTPYYTPYYTHPYTHPYTTPPSTRGLSVCLRYLTDYTDNNSPTLFTLSPRSSSSLTLRTLANGLYKLSFDRYGYYNMYLKSSIKVLPEVAPDMWTGVCLTVDSMKNVAQVFEGSNMSIRKMLRNRYSWTGEPVIEFSGFDGQVTDVQVWDYPLCYSEVSDYMSGGVYRLYRGSVLTWSYISYSLRGNALLEDVYELQAKQPMGRRGRGRRLKGEKKTRRVFSVGGRKGRETQQV
ncbi:uncharacterized protein [Trachinotus anak]|uniref:uncharacterized protein isoform X2 n=1 Tax=Trachinotus anak TaxID=443729 RepID=UPI0039F1E37A